MLCRLLLASCLASLALAQSPAIQNLRLHPDGSCSGVLEGADPATPFILQVTGLSADLWVGSFDLYRRGVRRLAVGSAEERALVQRLMAWSESAFESAERTAIEAKDDVGRRGSGRSKERHLEAVLVNRLSKYRRIRSARIRDLQLVDVSGERHPPGPDEVVVSFLLEDGLGGERRVVFCKVNDAWARPHLDGSPEPVAVGSWQECCILKAVRSHTREHIDERLRRKIWSGKEIAIASPPVPIETAQLFYTMCGYVGMTSPRLLDAAHLRDGGSVVFVFADGRGERFVIEFDKKVGSPTRGQIKFQGDGLMTLNREDGPFDFAIDHGSTQETRILRLLDRCLELSAAEPGIYDGPHATMLAEALAEYRKSGLEEEK